MVLVGRKYYRHGRRPTMITVKQLKQTIINVMTTSGAPEYVKLVDALIAAAREEGYREGCIEKDTEWRRGYNQGWEERKAFDQSGGALPTVLAPKEEK
jgi:hypothetical protein